MIDLVPTMLDAARLPSEEGLPGRSLQPQLAGQWTDPPSPVAFEYLAKQQWANPIRGLRAGRWQYNRYLWDGEELYDRQDDPVERQNLVARPALAATRDRLWAALKDWRIRMGDRRWEDERPAS